MAERLSRKELYYLVWSEPLRTLSSRFGISDVALKKTCVRAQIPTPDRVSNLDLYEDIATIEHGDDEPANRNESDRVEQGSEGRVRNDVLNGPIE